MTRAIGLRAVITAICMMLASCVAEPPWLLAEGQHRQIIHGEVRRPFDGQLLLFLPKGFSTHPVH